jgi:predicted nucleic acid-binding Zn finger protein
MNLQRLINISTDLTIKLAYSNIEGQVNFVQEDGCYYIEFIHYDDAYEEIYRDINIFDDDFEDIIAKKFEYIKSVIARERNIELYQGELML